MPPEVLESLRPVWIVPLVALLVHKTSQENGSIFEAGGGHIAKLRWERSGGQLLKCDESYTPEAILNKWDEVSDFKAAEYPSGPPDFMKMLERSMEMAPNEQGHEKVDFAGKVALITGGGAGYVSSSPNF